MSRSTRLQEQASRRPSLLARGLAAAAVLLLVSCHESGPDVVVPEAQTNSFESRPLLPRSEPPFSFVVTGHAYGRPGLLQPRPAATLVAGSDLLWQSAPDFSMLLGDTVFGWLPEDLGDTLPFLRDEMPSPVFNVPGNHELFDPDEYTVTFGSPWHAFEHAGCHMIMLDSESDPWLISGQQRLFLMEQIQGLIGRDEPPRMCCLFSHKPVWAMTHATVLTALLGNAAADLEPLVVGHDGPDSFARVVLPLLRELAETVPVLCFAGDFGAFPPVNMHLFAEQDPSAPNLRYYGCGIGDDYRDAFLTVTVPQVGMPEVRAHQLVTGQELPLSEFGHDDWLGAWFPHGLPAAVLAILDS